MGFSNLAPVFIGSALCLLIGSFQLWKFLDKFSQHPVGTEVQIVTPQEAFGTTMSVLYCTADWMDMAAFERHGLSFQHMWYLAYWLEILSGEHGRLKGNRATSYSVSDESQIDMFRDVLQGSFRRSLYYLESIDFISPEAQLAAQDWRYILGSVTNETVVSSAAWDYAKPQGLLRHQQMFDRAHMDLGKIFGPLTPQNIRKMFESLSINPLINETESKIEFRYGQVCYKVEMETGLSMNVTLKRPMIKRAEPLPTDALIKTEVLERHTTFPAGIHVSPYIGGLFPVWGGDDDNQYRRNSLIPCISGGYLERVSPAYELPSPVLQGFFGSDPVHCKNRCVDVGVEIDPMVAAIKSQVQQTCERMGTCEAMNPGTLQAKAVCGNGHAVECFWKFFDQQSSQQQFQNVQGFGDRKKRMTDDGRMTMNIAGGADYNDMDGWDDDYYGPGGWADFDGMGGLTSFEELDNIQKTLLERREAEGKINEGTEVCKNPDDLSQNEKLQFGKRMVISVFTLHAKLYKRLSTRTAKCLPPEQEDDMLPVYQDGSRCEATCQDKHIHQQFGDCTVSGLIYPGKQVVGEEDMIACDVIQFWSNMENATSNATTIETEIAKCIKDCLSLPRCRTYQARFVRGDQLYVKKESEEPFNYHQLVITPVDIKVTKEFSMIPWDSFVSYFGGLFGLFWGLSLLQVLMWPVDAVKACLKRKWSKKT